MVKNSKHRTHSSEDSFGRRLARLRKASGLSQGQLAEHLGTTQTLVSEYEHDNRRVHGQRLSQIAHLLHVSVDELLGHKASKTNGALSLKLVRRLKGIEELPPTKQKALLQLVDAYLRDSKRG